MPKSDQNPAAERTEYPTLLLVPRQSSDGIILTLGRRCGTPHQVWSAPAVNAALVASCFLAACRSCPPKALGDMLMIYTHSLRLEPVRLRRISDFIAHPSAVQL